MILASPLRWQLRNKFRNDEVIRFSILVFHLSKLSETQLLFTCSQLYFPFSPLIPNKFCGQFPCSLKPVVSLNDHCKRRNTAARQVVRIFALCNTALNKHYFTNLEDESKRFHHWAAVLLYSEYPNRKTPGYFPYHKDTNSLETEGYSIGYPSTHTPSDWHTSTLLRARRYCRRKMRLQAWKWSARAGHNQGFLPRKLGCLYVQPKKQGSVFAV